MNELFVVGLTGPTGAGKSVVATVLAECGCEIIDADLLARRAVEPHSPCLDELVNAFSADILLPDGSLDRPALAQRAFATPEATALLNRIVHPFVIRMTHTLLEQAALSRKTIAVIDAPLLFQAGMGAICDCTVAVIAPEQLRLQRIRERDGITEKQAKERMTAQPTDTYYTERATVVIQNQNDCARLRESALQLFERLEEWRHAR